MRTERGAMTVTGLLVMWFDSQVVVPELERERRRKKKRDIVAQTHPLPCSK